MTKRRRPMLNDEVSELYKHLRSGMNQGLSLQEKLDRIRQNKDLDLNARREKIKKTVMENSKQEKKNSPWEGAFLNSQTFARNGFVHHISKPLLSFSWSSSFSFSKCHLDTNVPYDNFITQFFDVEKFTRYARMFTRGYDVYTPTTNIVFHDYHNFRDMPTTGEKVGKNDMHSWAHDETEMRDSIARVHTILGIHDGERNDNAEQLEREHAELGIYGVGKLRSLKQLEAFTSINLKDKVGNVNNTTCTNLEWVPYNMGEDDFSLSSISHTGSVRPDEKVLSISPMDNLFTIINSESSDRVLDPQPEFPNRNVS